MAGREALRRLRAGADELAWRAMKPAGYHLTRRHFYSPIPIAEELPQRLWEGPSALPGIDLRVNDAAELLSGPLSAYLSEFRPPRKANGPGEFWLDNGGYGSVDAETLYAIVRHLKPKRIFELGSGASTHVIHLAAAANANDGHPLKHDVFDPFPYSGMMGPVPGAATHAIRAEDLEPAQFAELADGDVLFVDTTHTVRTGGDVTHIFLEILPRLTVGVMIHVHDIFLPYEYPRDWVVDRHLAWGEQYLLQAFLVFNRDFEVVMPNYALARAAPGVLEQAIPSFDPQTVRPGAFWFRRTSQS